MSKIIVFSADAMVGEDLKLLETLPNYRRYLKDAAQITNVRSVYPSVTYPAHATMRTGCFPDKHGIVSNYKFLPGVFPNVWQWTNDALKCSDIFDAAKAAGKTTAGSLWPSTGCHPSIDYLIDECWGVPGGAPVPEIFAENGASGPVMEIINKNRHIIYGERENASPWNEIFCVRCAADMIRAFQPDLLMLHPANIDDYRHHTGVFSPEVTHGIHETDIMIGEIVEAAIDAGVWENTNFFLVSDHGQRNITRNIRLNRLFLECGLIRRKKSGKLDYDAYSVSNGMSALVFLKDREDRTLFNRVYGTLKNLAARKIYGFHQVFTVQETKEKYHLGGDFSFVLESDGYSHFQDLLDGDFCAEKGDHVDRHSGWADHGYLPELGPQPILVAKGPDIRKNVRLDGGHIVDEAPTYAEILGVKLQDIDGSSIDEILR